MMSYTEEREAIGKAEGKAEGKEETARAMLRRGMDAALILEVTGITSERLQELQEEVARELLLESATE